jgi:hypothetical protein
MTAETARITITTTMIIRMAAPRTVFNELYIVCMRGAGVGEAVGAGVGIGVGAGVGVGVGTGFPT